MTDCEFVLTSTLTGLCTEGKRKIDHVVKHSLTLPVSHPDIQVIKRINAILCEKQFSSSDQTLFFEGIIRLTLSYQYEENSDFLRDFQISVPFSFQALNLASEKAIQALEADFFLEYIKIEMKTPRDLQLESKVAVLIPK